MTLVPSLKQGVQGCGSLESVFPGLEAPFLLGTLSEEGSRLFEAKVLTRE